jgi:heme O synthase-like polyprenyltransferase
MNRDDQSGLKHIALKQAKKLFIFSILNIMVLSVMMSIDFTVPDPTEMLLPYAP